MGKNILPTKQKAVPVASGREGRKMRRLLHILIFVLIFMIIVGNFPAGAEDINIHGFISQGYLKTDKNNYLAETDDGSFQFNEMGINFTTYVSSDLKVGCQFFARDLGDVGNDEIKVNWAFAEYQFRNWLGLRAGIIKSSFGFYNDTRDFDSLRTSIFQPASVYDEWLRDGLDKLKGIEIFGNIKMGPLGLLNYQLQHGVSPVALDSGTAKYLTEVGLQRLESLTSVKVESQICSRLFWKTPIDGLRIGGTYLQSGVVYNGTVRGGTPIVIDIEKSHTYTFSLEYMFHNFKISAENFRSKGDYVTTLGSFVPAPVDSHVKDPYYISVGYLVTDWLETAYYYSKNVSTAESMGSFNELKDHCISLRFNINFNWIVKLETHVMEGKLGVWPDDNGRIYNEWLLFAAKMSYSF